MGNKFSPIIIGVLLVVTIAIGILIYQILAGPNKTQQTPDVPEGPAEPIVPVLSLDREVGEDGTITIVAKASTEDVEGIEYIKLPDDNVVSDSVAKYVPTENKTYTFYAKAKNGQEVSAEIVISEVETPQPDKPYIPVGFDYIGGDIETGYIIADQYGNQYVWVPVKSGKLTRTTEFKRDYSENNTDAAALVNSVAKYYGFYIARFEASEFEVEGNKVAASMMGKTPWTDIKCTEAIEYANKASITYRYTDDIHTAIINSFAWDTAVAWIEETYPDYSSSTQYGNYDGMVLPTGMTEKDRLRGICDLSGNVREWTSEVYLVKDDTNTTNAIYRVVRGGGARLIRTPSSHIGYQEDTSDLYWGFRLMLYKNN